MAIDRPFFRTCRPFVGGDYYRSWPEYMSDPQFATAPDHYVRAYLLLIQDLRELFDFVEPADININTYSFRIHELLLRACVEVEANCKAVLAENGYPYPDKWTIKDYSKLNTTHRLADYAIEIPRWRGQLSFRRPFENWGNGHPLYWYREYNEVKHDRHNKFERANLGNMLDAICGVTVLLSAQFHTYNHAQDVPGRGFEVPEGNEAVYALGGYLKVRFPDTWKDEEMYDFKWDDIKSLQSPFQQFDYTTI